MVFSMAITIAFIKQHTAIQYLAVVDPWDSEHFLQQSFQLESQSEIAEIVHCWGSECCCILLSCLCILVYLLLRKIHPLVR